MSAATNGSTSASYIYDAFGKLIEKNVAGYETVLMYDESGHLLGEYTSYAVLVEETIWMGDIPVATLRRNGTTACTTTTVCLFYVHTDQLNAPRKISQPSSNTLAWRWDPDPFGTVAPTQNPGGLGTFVYNLRFPGQYYQAETGLNYNYFRDYDPQTGRYLASDPIGLGGGVNTYAYARGNPVSNIDPLGLSVEIIGSNAIVTAELQAAYNTVGGTLTGAALIDALESSPILYTITDDPLKRVGAGYLNSMHTIYVDPDFHPTINVNSCSGTEVASTATILGHEIGHAATGLIDDGPGNMNNVDATENLIRSQMGLPLRTSYPPAPPYGYYLGPLSVP